jgi:hypothetical protein
MAENCSCSHKKKLTTYKNQNGGIVLMGSLSKKWQMP